MISFSLNLHQEKNRLKKSVNLSQNEEFLLDYEEKISVSDQERLWFYAEILELFFPNIIIKLADETNLKSLHLKYYLIIAEFKKRMKSRSIGSCKSESRVEKFTEPIFLNYDCKKKWIQNFWISYNLGWYYIIFSSIFIKSTSPWKVISRLHKMITFQMDPSSYDVTLFSYHMDFLSNSEYAMMNQRWVKEFLLTLLILVSKNLDQIILI